MMTQLPSNAHEQRRLAALHRYQIIDTPPDSALDRITRLVGRTFEVPLAAVTFVDEQRVWLKSAIGMQTGESMERLPGMCSTAVMHAGVWQVPDTLAYEPTRTYPCVAKDGVRFYAGAPICTRDKYNLGVLCIMDYAPRTLSEREQLNLIDFADMVVGDLEMRLMKHRMVKAERTLRLHAMRQAAEAEREASTDVLTGLKNRRAFQRDLATHSMRQQAQPSGDTLLVMLDMDGMKAVNDQYGHARGDDLLRTFAHLLNGSLRPGDSSYRLGGDEFAVLLPVSDRNEAAHWYLHLRSTINNVRAAGFPDVDISIGFAALSEAPHSYDTVQQLADGRMYAEKVRHHQGAACEALVAAPRWWAHDGTAA